MKVLRKLEVDVDNFKIGDQIQVGKYTATCQKIVEYNSDCVDSYKKVFGFIMAEATDEDTVYLHHLRAKYMPKREVFGLFCLDQYIDKDYCFNDSDDENVTYETSSLRKMLNNIIVRDCNFDSIRNRIIRFENGDLLRIPTVEELFGKDILKDVYEPDLFGRNEQWQLMVYRKNLVAYRNNEPEWGWLMNKIKKSASNFAAVGNDGNAGNYYASTSNGVRPVFQLKIC